MACCKKDDGNDMCGVIGRVFVYIFGFIGIAFSLLTVFSCQFISYSTSFGSIPNTLPPPFSGSEQAKVGLFRWDNLVDGCVYYTNEEISGFNSALRTAQIVAYVAVLCAAVSLFLGTIEFVCCRFCCSKFFLSFFMVFATITQALTFAVFASDDMCSNGRYCSMQLGAIFSIVAASCYFICSLTLCFAPKPIPWIKRVKADDDDTGCLACCTKKQPQEDVEEKKVPVTDSPAEADDNAGAAVAAGAAAGAGTAAVVAAANDDDEKDLEKGQDDDSTNQEAAPPPAADAETGDEESGNAVAPGDDAVGDEDASEMQSEVPSVAPSEPSQAGEEITLELSKSMSEAN